MESVDLDMDDLFETRDYDEDVGAEQEDVPDEEQQDGQEMEETQEGDGDEELGSQALSRLKEIKKGAAKKKVMRPQPKLDAKRLTGDRGIPLLPKLFADVKFKGKGHEAEDLKCMMQIMEHWAHRLFPKMPFDEVIERVEKLGAKKEVQTCVKKIRNDMPLLDEDYIDDRVSDKESDHGDADKAQDNDEGMDFDADEAFDEMIRQEKEKQRLATAQEEEEEEEEELLATLTPKKSQPPTPSTGSLTEEQQERMERNKRIAMEKRLAKMKRATGSSDKDRESDEKRDECGADKTSKSNMGGSKETAVDDLQTEDEIMNSLENEDTDSIEQTSDNVQTEKDHNSALQEKVDKINESKEDMQTENEIMELLSDENNDLTNKTSSDQALCEQEENAIDSCSYQENQTTEQINSENPSQNVSTMTRDLLNKSGSGNQTECSNNHNDRENRTSELVTAQESQSVSILQDYDPDL